MQIRSTTPTHGPGSLRSASIRATRRWGFCSSISAMSMTTTTSANSFRSTQAATRDACIRHTESTSALSRTSSTRASVTSHPTSTADPTAPWTARTSPRCLRRWGTPGGVADLSPAAGDGVVDAQDLVTLLGLFGPCNAQGMMMSGSSIESGTPSSPAEVAAQMGFASIDDFVAWLESLGLEAMTALLQALFPD
jgi:hypothetical protein